VVCRGTAEAADSADRHSPRLVQTVNHKSQAEYHTGSWGSQRCCEPPVCPGHAECRAMPQCGKVCLAHHRDNSLCGEAKERVAVPRRPPNQRDDPDQQTHNARRIRAADPVLARNGIISVGSGQQKSASDPDDLRPHVLCNGQKAIGLAAAAWIEHQSTSNALIARQVGMAKDDDVHVVKLAPHAAGYSPRST